MSDNKNDKYGEEENNSSDKKNKNNKKHAKTHAEL